MRLPGRSVNSALSNPEHEVVLVETVPCSSGDRFSVTFESVEARWRQGIWLAVEGELVIGDHAASQIVLWSDAAPEHVSVEVRSTRDGLMRFYNVWDSGRGRGYESQAHTSGMLREVDADGIRYRCSDINPEPSFEALVFKIGPVA